MLKQNGTNNFLSPIHCAVINSNTDLLHYILKHISQFNVGDSLNRKPIHYAAVLQNTKSLQLLLKYGADLKDFDKKKMTPLMLASYYGRYDNIKYILDKVRDSQYLNFRSQDGLSALHYATIQKHQQCLSLLLDDSLINKNLQTKQGMNIMHLAAGGGSRNIIKMLLDKQIQINWDQYRRSPLMLAIRNYHNDIFFLLLNKIPKYYRKDYSYNTLLHYAAAYGNLQIVKYLLEIIQQIQNKKLLYPFQIAVLKGHLMCAKILQNKQLIFNQHLLNRLLKNPRGNKFYIQMVEYLLSTKLYDINQKNLINGNTCLHLVCSLSQNQYKNIRNNQIKILLPNQYQYMQKQLLTKLLLNGANPLITNQKDQKPVNLCIQNQNLIGIQLLLQQIPFYIQPPTKNNHFIYYLCNLACKGKRQINFVLNKIIQVQQKILKIQLKKTDTHGFQFLIYLIKKFTQTVHQNFYNNYKIILNDGIVPLDWQDWRSNQQLQQFKKNRAIVLSFLQFLQYQNYLIKMINFLIDNGCDPNVIVIQPKVQKQYQNYKNWSIHHFLMKFPSLKLLKIFMKWNKNFTMQNSQGRTPLHLFCMWNQQGFLFSKKQINNNNLLPQIDIGSIRAYLPFMSLNQIQINKFQQILDYQGQKCLQYLLENGLSPNVLDINRSLPILYAALNGQSSFIILLRRFGSSINNSNIMNQVPLIQIIKMKNIYTINQIQQFIKIGADPNYQDLNKRNVLHHLVSNSTNFDISPQLCKLLFQRGCKVNSLDRFLRSPIFYCFIKIQSQQSTNNNNNISIKQPNNDKVQILQTLLNHKQIDLNILDIYQRTLLHYACQRNSFFSILYLLDKNINYDIPDYQGNTPLAICLKYRNLNQAALLIKKGVKYGHVIDQGQRFSYFTYAINKLSVGICFMLIDHGYPLQKALQQVPNQAFKKVLTKKYYNSNSI